MPNITPGIGKKSFGSCITGYPQQIINYALDTVFPVKCLGCGVFSPKNRQEYLCKSCLRTIPLKKTGECIGCKRTSPAGKTCYECRDSNPIDNLLVVSDYKNHLIEKLLKVFKYNFVVEASESLNPLIKKYISHLNKYKGLSIVEGNPLIVPIPLHPKRLNWRGFNQAEIIAGIISNLTHLETMGDLLLKSGQSKPQAEIEEKVERLKNMKQKFKLSSPEKIRGRTIILVDDICTTGATLNEAASILKSSGASKVIGFVIARG